MSAYECIQGFSQNLFWDVRLESIDLEANAPYVVQRVLEYGQLDDWKLLVAFVSLATSIPKESFRCYTSRQSNPKHWEY